MAEKLYDLIDQEDLRQTGRLVKFRSLRFRSTREVFAWTNDCCAHRFFTKGTIKQALVILVREYGLAPPLLGDYNLESWLEEQTKVVHYLCKRAVKNAWEREYSRACRAMAVNPDEMETQAYAWGDEDRVMISAVPIAH